MSRAHAGRQAGPQSLCKDNSEENSFSRWTESPEPTTRNRSLWPVAAHGCGAEDRPRLPGVAAGSGSLELTRRGSRRPEATGRIEAVVDRPHWGIGLSHLSCSVLGSVHLRNSSSAC